MRQMVLTLMVLVASCAPAAAAPAKVPIFYSTDLYHPHGDPDDHYDLATLLAIEEFDVRGIVIDVRLEVATDVGRAPLEQMIEITKRRIPYAVGARRVLRTPTDPVLDEPAEFQGGIELILSVLRNAKEKKSVVVFLAGSCRDLAAAYNREPELVREKVKAVYCNAGNGPDGVQWEWNVRLDPKAYERLFAAGLPFYWCPCWGPQAGELHRLATYFRADQTAVVGACTPAVQNFFVYCLTRSPAEPIAFLSTGPHPLPTGTRNMWCTGPFLHAAGRQIYRREQGFVALPPEEAKAAGLGKPIEAFRFVPMRATLAESPAPAADKLAEPPPGTLAAAFQDVATDRVGTRALEPDSKPDCHVGILGVDPDKPIRNLVLIGPKQGRWEYVETGRWWRVAYERQGRRLDGFFQFHAPGEHQVEIVYADGSTQAAKFTVPKLDPAAPFLRVDRDPAEPNGYAFETIDPQQYEEILASVLQNLLAGLGR